MSARFWLWIVLGLSISSLLNGGSDWPNGLSLPQADLVLAYPVGELYGDGKGLSCQQSVRIQWLSFPQRYRSIITAFGYPDVRGKFVDYYKLCNSRWVGLVYSEDNQAVQLIRAD